jgi:hypothetical protein
MDYIIITLLILLIGALFFFFIRELKKIKKEAKTTMKIHIEVSDNNLHRLETLLNSETFRGRRITINDLFENGETTLLDVEKFLVNSKVTISKVIIEMKGE